MALIFPLRLHQQQHLQQQEGSAETKDGHLEMLST